MKNLFYILISLLSFNLSNSQTYARVIQGNHPNIEYSLDGNNGDTLKISSRSRDLWKVETIHSETLESVFFTRNPYKIDSTFIIPLSHIKGGWHSVIAYDTKGDLNGFRLYKIIDKTKTIKLTKDSLVKKIVDIKTDSIPILNQVKDTISLKPQTKNITSFMCIEKIESNFASVLSKGSCDLNKVIRLVNKNRADILTRTGKRNYVVIYVKYSDGTQNLIYKTQTH